MPVCACKSADIVFAIDVSYSMSGPTSSCGSTDNFNKLVRDLTSRVITQTFGAQTVDKYVTVIMQFAVCSRTLNSHGTHSIRSV